MSLITGSFPKKIVKDHTFRFSTGAITLRLTETDSIEEYEDAFVVRCTDAGEVGSGSSTAEVTTYYKSHLLAYSVKTSEITDYPPGESPAEQAMKEIDDKGRAAEFLRHRARTQPREGA